MFPPNLLAQEQAGLSTNELVMWTAAVATFVVVLTVYGFVAFARWSARDRAKREKRINRLRDGENPNVGQPDGE
jgi:heme/copper-type cytochrome/quinol oxidase subunit 2